MQELKTVETVTISGEITENTNLQTTNVILSQDFNNALDAKIEGLKSGKKTIGLSLTPKYMEFDKVGEPVEGIFLGFKIIHKKNDAEKIKQGEPEMASLTCAIWADENKNVWLNGGIAFISSFENIQIGQAFQATLVEKKAAGAGKVKIYEIKPIFFNE